MPFDFIDEIDRQEEKERRARMVAEAQEAIAREAEKAREAAARVAETTARANARALVREYRAAGVEPPFTNGHGIPTRSLSMLLSLGWKIEQLGRDRVLVKPDEFAPGILQSQV